MTLLTEDEAKERWCPFARYAVVSKHVVSAAGNRFGDDVVPLDMNPKQSRCIGSACMAWRWQPTGEGESKIEGIKRRREETGASLVEAKNYVEAHPEYLKKEPSDLGFCGLAGRPS